MLQKLIQDYKKFSKADKYIIGFKYKKMYYYYITNTFDEFTRFDKASRNGGMSLRLRILKDQKQNLLSVAIPLCTEEDFNKTKAQTGNNGETFERLIFIKFNKAWKKDNTPFYISGDIQYKGVEYQIKFERATFTNEKQIKRLYKVALLVTQNYKK